MNLKNSTILIVNDDGLDAFGLGILERAAKQHCDNVWVVAPATDQSGRARALSYRKEVLVEPRGEKRFAVGGTPADCVVVALNGLLGGQTIDLVLSGVNDGHNVADDVASSGTVGACLEAADQNVPGIAFSQGWSRAGEGDWTCAEQLTVDTLPRLAAAISDPRMVLNVNFPYVRNVGDVVGCRVVHAGWRDGPTSLEERRNVDGNRVFYIENLREDRPNEPDCDLDLLHRGHLTVTPLTLDQTNHSALRTASERLETLV